MSLLSGNCHLKQTMDNSQYQTVQVFSKIIDHLFLSRKFTVCRAIDPVLDLFESKPVLSLSVIGHDLLQLAGDQGSRLFIIRGGILKLAQYLPIGTLLIAGE